MSSLQELQYRFQTDWGYLAQDINLNNIKSLAATQWEINRTLKKGRDPLEGENEAFKCLKIGTDERYTYQNRLMGLTSWFTYLEHATKTIAVEEMRKDFHNPLVDQLFGRTMLIGRINEYLSNQASALTR